MFGKSVNTDYLMSLLIAVIDDTADMAKLYEDLPKFLSDEITMIRQRQYENLAQVTGAKIEHCEKIEACFDRMSEISKKITFLHRENFYDAARNADSLTSIHEMFADFQDTLLGRNLIVEQTLAFNLQKFRRTIDRLVRIKTDIKPLIEFNRTVTAEISKNYQMSMRFWEELSHEQTSSYTAQGVRGAVGGLSTIIAKA